MLSIYKLLALDIDGTLINQKMEITAPTRKAIQLAQDRGVLVTLATGRSFHSAKYCADQLKINIPLICSNGSYICARNGEVFREMPLAKDTAAKMIGDMAAAGLFVQAYHRDGMYSIGQKAGIVEWVKIICDSKLQLGKVIYSIREYRRSRITFRRDLVELVARGEVSVHKLFCAGNQEQLAEFHKRAKKLGLTVEFYPGSTGIMYLEIMPDGASKGSALTWLAAHLNIAMEDIVAVGDNLNDLPMVREAGLGIAMGNGHSQLKAAAGYITLSNDDDGIAAVIEKFFLNPAQTREAI